MTARTETLYVFGGGGHAREAAELAVAAGFASDRIVHLVNEERYLRPSVEGRPVELLGADSLIENSLFTIAVGDGALRRELAENSPLREREAAILVHPSVMVSATASLAPGVIVAAASVVSSAVGIGEHSHVNYGCTLSHDVRLGRFVTVSPGVTIAGNVQIGDDVFIGAGATIINGSPSEPLVIGRGAIIAAAACVLRSVDESSLMAGVPAVRKR